MLQDAVLRDNRAKKRDIRWPVNGREEEALVHQEVARIHETHEYAELSFAEWRGGCV